MDTDSYVVDAGLAPEGQQQIDFVSGWMPVTNRLYERFAQTGVFVHKRISVCAHLEAKTAHLALLLKDLGAQVWITGCNPLTTKDDVAAALSANGIHVFAKHAASDNEYWSYIDFLVHNRPHAVIDVGGDLGEHLHQNPEYGIELKGICEVTTTGVQRLLKFQSRNELRYPTIAINNARSKFLFANRYGAGQSVWTAIMSILNMNIAGKVVSVIGYGWVGRGIAMRAKGLGAEVIVAEIDPWKALEARMEGYRVMPAVKAVPHSDIIITATGEKQILTHEHFKLFRDGTFLANASHFDHEIDLSGLSRYSLASKKVKDGIEEFSLPRSRKLYLLAHGAIINAAGDSGLPIEIMDLSLALQLGCIHHLLSSVNLDVEVHQVPNYIDEMVVREKLKSDGIEIDGKNIN